MMIIIIDNEHGFLYNEIGNNTGNGKGKNSCRADATREAGSDRAEEEAMGGVGMELCDLRFGVVGW